MQSTYLHSLWLSIVFVILLALCGFLVSSAAWPGLSLTSHLAAAAFAEFVGIVGLVLTSRS